MPLNKFDSITIFYNGRPPASLGEAIGYQRGGTTGNYNIYTLSESFEDRDWWPCKADMQDRVDSMDFVINVPNGYTAAANGKLVDSSLVDGNRVFVYKHRYSIPSYLVAVSVAKYTKYHRGTVNISGTQVPIVYYVYSSRGTSIETQLNAMDKVKPEMVAFSNLFGDYPFKNEKYGMYEFGWGGGMEHSTFSAMGWSTMSSWSVIAHELAHQWFGNKVTFSTWNHLWLAEGFAKYLEVLAAEFVPGIASATSHLSGIRTNARSTSNAPYGAYIPNSSITSSTVLWSSAYGSTTYYRGAMIVSMIRALLGDEKFFQACRNYLNDPALAYKSATSDDLLAHFNAVAGRDISGFFNDYVYNGGYPTYNIRYGVNSKLVTIQVNQSSRTSSPLSYMRSPVVLRIKNASRDTTVVIYDQNGTVSKAGNGISAPVSGNILRYQLSFVPSSIEFDPLYVTMSTGTASALASLPINIIDFKAVNTNKTNEIRLWLDKSYEHDDVEIERSLDGKNFNTIGNMVRRTASTPDPEYVFTDPVQPALFVYYRSRITDIDGTVKFTSVVKVQNAFDEEDQLIISLTSSASATIVVPEKFHGQPCFLKVVSTAGQLIRSEKRSRDSNPRTELNLKGIPPGIYYLELSTANGLRSSKQFTVLH